ncbi:MAG: penicillin-binding protein 2 [Candidatus Eiseniibacteriota bacterium]|nr:MAG: penicillin-binding protein 2 [Candidatus Eisenbacteria bacterium]
MRQRSSHLNSKQTKALVLKVVAFALLAVVVGRLFYFQVWHGRAYAEQAKHNRVRLEILSRIRGRLLDRNGQVVAENIPSYCLSFDPYEKQFVSKDVEVDEVLVRISELLGLERLEEWRALVERGKEVPFRPVRLMCNLDITQISIIKENRARLPGVRIEARPRRHYPNGELACHFLGYVSEVTGTELKASGEDVYQPGDTAGRTGVEGGKEEALRGRNGKEYVEVDACGRKVQPTPDRPPLPPKEQPAAGKDVVLTLDLGLQRAAEAALEAYQSGAVVIVDPRDGAVLAVVSKPGFDPNQFSVGLSPEEWNQLNSHPLHPLLNRVTQALYPPGSTLKVLTAAAGLEENATAHEGHFESCTGSYRFGRRVFRCWREQGHGRVSFNKALEVSCDVYFYQLGLRLSIDKLAGYARRFGLDERTGIGISGEKAGFYPTTDWYDRQYGSRKWGKGVLLNLAIGQGEILTTPIELATFCAAIANGGYLYEPYVVRRELSYGSQWSAEARPLRRKARAFVGLSESTFAALRRAMEDAVSGIQGTGRLAAIPGIRVAGKTGTAQNPHGEDHALFVGFAPAEAPEIAFAIVVENAGHGGSVAAPVAGRLLRAFFHLPEIAHADTTQSEGSLETE